MGLPLLPNLQPLNRAGKPYLLITLHDDQIIQVNLTSDNPVAVVDGANLEFTYSVNWVHTSVPFARRFERYLDYSFFEHKVWTCSAAVLGAWRLFD